MRRDRQGRDRDRRRAPSSVMRSSCAALIYDTTNFATFIDSGNAANTIAQRGHAKGGRHDLRLIGLALCVALDANIPLCHQPPYEGNRYDSSQFLEAIKPDPLSPGATGAHRAGTRSADAVYDKGNNSKANQPLADELRSAGRLALPVPSPRPARHSARAFQRRSRGCLARSPTAPQGDLRARAYDRRLILQRFAAKQQRSFHRHSPRQHRELDELKGVVQRGRHRMDERALSERTRKILKRRWLKDVITIEHDLAAQRLQLPHRPGRDRSDRRARVGQTDHLHRPPRVDRPGDHRRLPRPSQGRAQLPPDEGPRVRELLPSLPLDRPEAQSARLLLHAGADDRLADRAPDPPSRVSSKTIYRSDQSSRCACPQRSTR